MHFPSLKSFSRYHLKTRNLYALLVIAIVVMASMVVVLRGKSPQHTVLQLSSLNSVEPSYYVQFGNTIWQDDLTNATQWTNSTTVSLVANGALEMNGSFASKPNPQSVRLSRSVNLPLYQSPIVLITLEASIGIHYGIRISGQDPFGTPFDAWSESSYLQHRKGLGQFENFTINPTIEAYNVNGVFPASGSVITSLLFYVEVASGQSGQFSLNISEISVVSLNKVLFDPAASLSAKMNGIVLNVNFTNSLGYTDKNFFTGFADFFISGTSNLVYTVYYMHNLAVLGQGFDYSSGSSTYDEVAVFQPNKVRSYPPFLISNNTVSIVLGPEAGHFQSFQLNGFSARYLDQSTLSTSPVDLDTNALFTYYIAFLFVTPITIMILIERVSSRETKHL